MSLFRQIHTHIWKDPWYFRLQPPQKLQFVYLFSNERVSVSGIYEISIEIISFETGLPIDFVKSQLEYFQQEKKAFYDFETEVIWVRNLRKYNATGSQTVLARIAKDLAGIPDCEIKQVYSAFYDPSIPYPDIDISYLYGIDTVSAGSSREYSKSIGKGKEKDNAGGGPPSSLQGWLDVIKNSKNTPADLLYMFKTLYPDATESPSFSYIGRVSKNVGGAGRLGQLLWEGASNRPTGDVLRYIQGIHRKQTKQDKQPKQPKQSKRETEKVLEQLENGD